MHRDDPRAKYRRELDRLETDAEDGTISKSDCHAIKDTLDALDPENREKRFEHDGERKTLATNSLDAYLSRLRMVAKEVDRPLLELSQDDVTGLMADLESGEADAGPSDGYAANTLGQFMSSLMAVYRYHDGHDVDPEKIDAPTPDTSSVDERDLWTVDEIARMREVIDSKRNEAMFELLAYTGQRIRIIQTLRVKDIDLDAGATGRYYVNENVEGRKNREGQGPLLGAQGAVRRWLQIHPTGEPGDALITCPPENTGGATPGERVAQNSVRRVLRRIADAADVDKDVHPHMFRHYFTTIALKPKSRGGFEMDPSYVKRLRGDGPGSTVMETTYSHLIDEDAAVHAEGQFTGEEPEDNALTPAAPCGVCGEMLQAGDAACANCGAGRTPEAEESSALSALIPYLGDMDDAELGRVIREYAESEAAD